MRSDNGVPFACNGLAGLTELSAYWLRLGITLERWLVSFMHRDLGYVEPRCNVFTPITPSCPPLAV